MVVLPAYDELLSRASIKLPTLEGRRWVHFAVTHGLAEVVDLCCAAAGFTPRVAVRTSQVPAAARFAATGLGPALLPEHSIPDALVEFARPLSPPVVRAVVAYSRQDWTPLTAAFLDTLRSYPWRPMPAKAVDLR